MIGRRFHPEPGQNCTPVYIDTNLINADQQIQARYTDQFSAQRTDGTLIDLIDAQNVRARGIADAVDAGNQQLVDTLKSKDAPLKVINELLTLSNIPIVISVEQNDHVKARKSGSVPYSIAELSDGERNALLIAATVLTVPTGALVLIDDPERHLHKSIISPLLTLLFRKRADCMFVVSTHDVELPADNPEAQTILIRSCVYQGQNVEFWDVDLLPGAAPIIDSVKKDILGSRRKVIFVEGDNSSLDKALYSFIFPNASIVAKGGCAEVKSAFGGVRGSHAMH